jgi:hypothetical protein
MHKVAEVRLCAGLDYLSEFVKNILLQYLMEYLTEISLILIKSSKYLTIFVLSYSLHGISIVSENTTILR